MQRMSAWFERHTKTRIALQLALDAAPFLLLVVFGVCMWNIFSYPLALEWLMNMGIFGFFMLTLPLFILGIWLRGRAEGEFACYPWCATVSKVLRILGVLAASFSVFLGFLAILAFIEVQSNRRPPARKTAAILSTNQLRITLSPPGRSACGSYPACACPAPGRRNSPSASGTGCGPPPR